MNTIPHHPIFIEVAHVAALTAMPVHAIGGYVRDGILGRNSKDIDFVVLGSGIVFAEALAKHLNKEKELIVFKNFGTAMLRLNDIEIEIVGARRESYRAESRKPIVENGTLEDDQNRRDFTINALAISLNSANFGEIIDPFGGIKDLENKIIRTPLNPDITYSDDPLRMLRAIRFATQLGFTIEQNSFESIAKNAHRIKIISGERIADELNKIILTPKPSIGFNLLDKSGLLDIIFPQFTALKGVDYKNGRGHKDNFHHTLEVLDNICADTEDLWLRWAAILHDIAKPATKRWEDGAGWTFHGHEDKGARMVPKIFNQLKLPQNEKMRFVEKLVRLHLRPIVLAQDVVTDSAVRRLLFDAGEDTDALMTLCKADVTTKNEYKQKKYRNNFELVKQKLIDVEQRDHVRNWQPALTGTDIMQHFGLPEGRSVGLLKTALREAILEGDIPNEREESIAFLEKIANENGFATFK